jgi:hypothetical protein
VRARRPSDPAGRAGPAPARAARQPTLRGSLIGLHRSAGNRAVGRLVRGLQRKVGWSDAVTDGYAWNKEERQVGAIRRIPLEGLPVGGPADATIKSLTPESSARRAIVLLPKALDAGQEVEYVVFLHGHTEDSSTRPFAGWRAYKPPPPPRGRKPPPPKDPKDETSVEKLRHGIDATDVAPVRDVALDEAEQQLEDSGLKQTVMILPQGGLTSEFGDAGDKNFDAGNYVDKIADRLLTEHCWLDAQGKPATAKPKRGRLVMAGHSGAGATFRNMIKGAAGSSAIPGDLVIFDAINGDDQYKKIKGWMLNRLDTDLQVLTSNKTDDEKLKYLQSAPKLRGFWTELYRSPYTDLEGEIRGWFSKHATELGPFARCLRQNFMLTYVGGEHERLMHGVGTGKSRRHGILEALQDLHRPLPKSPDDCPKMPEELEEEERQRKLEERRRKLEEQRERARQRRNAPAKKVKAPG